MFDSLEEVRYPWADAINFWQGGYWVQIESLHLVIATLFLTYIFFKALFQADFKLEFRLAILYFALTVFNNPAFSLAGLNPNEIFGVAAVIVILFRGRLLHGRKSSLAVKGLLITFLITGTHALIATLIYPELIPDFGTALIKTAVIFKIFILAVNLAIVGVEFAKENCLEILLRFCLLAGTFSLLMYLVQILVMISGSIPFGTYLDAGFIGLPSFGSVSIERGHFGKFMAPYFPIFLYALIKWRARFRFLLYCFVTILNFSASSQFFFFCSLVITALLFFSTFNLRTFAAISMVGACIFSMVIFNWEVFEGIFDKIVSIAIKGDESQGGGRSIGLFFEYVKNYPLGMGYSGSSLRTAPNLPEINASYFAFVAQYSILSIPIGLGFIYLVKRGFILRAKVVTHRCFNVGILMAPVIFLTDILWFVPLVWLAIEINLSTRN
jgi:hypothetical protein